MNWIGNGNEGTWIGNGNMEMKDLDWEWEHGNEGTWNGNMEMKDLDWEWEHGNETRLSANKTHSRAFS